MRRFLRNSKLTCIVSTERVFATRQLGSKTLTETFYEPKM